MGFFNAKWWEYLIPGYGQWKMTEDVYKGSTGLLSDVISRISTGQSRQEAAENSALSQQAALEHAEEREDTELIRNYDQMQSLGINPLLIGNFGGASSGAAQAQVNSEAQRQQAQAANTQALASLISSAAMLMMTKGRGLPVVTSGGTSAAMMDLLADGRGLSKAEKHAIDTYKMYHKI